MKNIILLILAVAMVACGLAPQRSSVPVVEGRPDGSAEIKRETDPVESAPSIESFPTASSTQSASNPAVLALLGTAQQQRRQQKYVAAAASLERAIRISPRNAELYLELAKVRQEQGNQGQAEQLCKKAVALSNQATAIKFNCLALLSEN